MTLLWHRLFFYRNPNSGGANKERYHARVVSSGQISTEQLAKEINQECSLTPADIKAVLVSLSDKLAKHLSEGHKVYLEGIGHFQVNLRCKLMVFCRRALYVGIRHDVSELRRERYHSVVLDRRALRFLALFFYS